MKKKILLSVLALTSLLLIFTSSCKKDDDKDEDITPTLSDESFYKEVAFALIKSYTDIYNQNLAGTPTGAINMTVNGPLGGTVTITGTSSYDNTHGITTVNLFLSMSDIITISSYANLTLTGGTTYAGSFSDTYTSVNHQSDNIYINGSVTRNGVTRQIDMTGEVSINRTSTTTAIIFGHTVSW